jgi:hypothetical protein
MGTYHPIYFPSSSIYDQHNNAKIDDQMYPLLFALLPGTIQAVYTQLLTKLKTYMADIQLFMNFETAAHNATRTMFPMGDFLLQFVVPTLDVIYGNGYICVEVVPYSSVTVDPLGYNIVREGSCVGWCISVI